MTADGRREMAAEHLLKLWGSVNGWAFLGFGIKPTANAAGKITHQDFTQETFEWPLEIGTAVERIVTMADHGHDVWNACCLMAERRRKPGHAIPGCWAWAEVDDGWTIETQEVLRLLAAKAKVRVIASGGRPDNAHVYVKTEIVAPSVLHERNRMLRDLLGGDSKFSLETLLRPPGSFNWKPVARGESDEPSMVQPTNVAKIIGEHTT